jgi:hypothetical protein
MTDPYCKFCNSLIAVGRHDLGYSTCMPCGQVQAQKVSHTIVPMHKSNYMVISDLEDLKGINNKGGLYR